MYNIPNHVLRSGWHVRGPRGARQAPRNAGLLCDSHLLRRRGGQLVAFLRDARAHHARRHARHRRPRESFFCIINEYVTCIMYSLRLNFKRSLLTCQELNR